MTVFGMGGVMHDTEPVHTEDCLSHCLSETSASVVIPSLGAMPFPLLAWVAAGVLSLFVVVQRDAVVRRAWAFFVGKYRLKWLLAPVMIRD